MSEPQGKERRKYQRVQFDASPQTLAVNILGHGGSVVFDMSYSGAAFAQPDEKKVSSPGDVIEIHMKSNTQDEARMNGRVVRCDDRVLAVEFTEVPGEARLLIDRLISDRMIGLNMNLIDPKHYNANSGFSYWFHGPKETNLFLWSNGDDLEKAQFDLNNVVMVYESEEFFFENKENNQYPADMPHLNHQQIMQKGLSIISQMHTNLKPLHQFKDLLEQQVN